MHRVCELYFLRSLLTPSSLCKSLGRFPFSLSFGRWTLSVKVKEWKRLLMIVQQQNSGAGTMGLGGTPPGDLTPFHCQNHTEHKHFFVFHDS